MRTKNILPVILMLLLAMLVGEGNVSAQGGRMAARKVERQMAGSKRKSPKENKVREPRSVTRAKRAQEKKAAGREKEYRRAVKDNKNRHLSIQTDEVKARMKQNELDLKLREKEKRKKARKDSRKPGSAGKKYKK